MASTIVCKEILPVRFTLEEFLTYVGKFGSISTSEKAYADGNGVEDLVILGEIKFIREKATSDVLIIDIQEEASVDGPAKLLGVFAFKHSASEIIKLNLKPGDFIAIQGAVIEESPCYFIPQDYYKIHARILDSPGSQTKVWFMRKSSVPASRAPEEAKETTMQKYFYSKLCKIVAPIMPAHIYGIIVSHKEPETRPSGRLMVRVGLIDETAYTVDVPFELFIYCAAGEVAPKIETYQVLRAHRVKVEPFNGRLDGRVYKASDIVTISSDVTSLNCVCSTAKTYEWTENDKARVMELYNWMWAQPWYRPLLNNNAVQHMIEDISAPGLIRLICKITEIQTSRDGECIVLTVCDGTICTKHVKTVRNVEGKTLSDIQNEDNCYKCNQMEVDVVVTQLTDDFKLLRGDDFVCLNGLEVKINPSQSTDSRLLLSLTMNARQGSVHVFEPNHSVAKRIKRMLSSPRVLVDDRLARLDSDKNLISLQDITNSSFNLSNSLVTSPARTVSDQVLPPTKKRGCENEFQSSAGSVKKKLKSPSNFFLNSSSEVPDNIVDTCDMLLATYSPSNESSTVNSDNDVIESGGEMLTDSGKSKNTPMLTFSIGNSDKALQSLQKKITENYKNQISRPDGTISGQESVIRATQGGEKLQCDVFDTESHENDLAAAADVTYGTLEKELEIIFGESNQMTPQKNSTVRNCDSLSKKMALPHSCVNDVPCIGSEGSSSAVTYSQFHSKLLIGPNITSTQNTQSCDRREKNCLRSEKHRDKSQNTIAEAREEVIEESRDLPQKETLHNESKSINSVSKAQHLLGINVNSVVCISPSTLQQQSEESQNIESQNHFSTYNSHPTYGNMFPSVAKDGSVCTGMENKHTRKQSKTKQPALSECRGFNTASSQSLTSHNVAQSCTKLARANFSSSHSDNKIAHANFSSSSHSDNVLVNGGCSGIQELQLDCGMNKLSDVMVTAFDHMAQTSNYSDQGERCDANSGQAAINNKEHSQYKSSRKAIQVGTDAGEDKLDETESSAETSSLPDRSRSSVVVVMTPLKNGTLNVEDAIPSFKIVRDSASSSNVSNSNFQPCGSNVSNHRVQVRNCNCEIESAKSPKHLETKDSAIQNANERLNCASSETIGSSQSNEKEQNAGCSRPCVPACSCHGKNAGSVEYSPYLGISPAVKTVMISGWLIDVKPPLPGNLVSGYCINCNRIQRFSLAKECLSKQGKRLCVYCQCRGFPSVLTLMYCFTLKVAIQSGTVFSITVGDKAAEILFGIGAKDYVTDEKARIFITDFLKKLIVADARKRTYRNRLECGVIYSFEDNVYTLKQILYKSVDLQEI